MSKLQLSCGMPPRRDVVALARAAEAAGYARFYCYDSPALYGDLWIALARVAEGTRRIGLGTAVAVPCLRDPMVTASAIATIEELAPGRLLCAFGSGYTARRAMGKRAMSWKAMARFVDQLRGLLRGEVVQIDGAACQMLHVPGFAPRRPIELPILVAPMGPKGLATAHELGCGVMLAGEAVAGFPHCALMASGSVLDPGEDHRTPRVREAVGPWFKSMYHATWEFSRAAVDSLPGGAEWRRRIESERPEGERHLAVHEGHVEAVPERERFLLDAAGPLLLQSGWTGDAASVRARAEKAVAAGADEIVYMPAGPDIPRELQAFARAVRD